MHPSTLTSAVFMNWWFASPSAAHSTTVFILYQRDNPAKDTTIFVISLAVNAFQTRSSEYITLITPNTATIFGQNSFLLWVLLLTLFSWRFPPWWPVYFCFMFSACIYVPMYLLLWTVCKQVVLVKGLFLTATLFDRRGPLSSCYYWELPPSLLSLR